MSKVNKWIRYVSKFSNWTVEKNYAYPTVYTEWKLTSGTLSHIILSINHSGTLAKHPRVHLKGLFCRYILFFELQCNQKVQLYNVYSTLYTGLMLCILFTRSNIVERALNTPECTTLLIMMSILNGTTCPFQYGGT